MSTDQAAGQLAPGISIARQPELLRATNEVDYDFSGTRREGLDRFVRRREGRCRPARSLRVSLDLRSSLAPAPDPVFGLGRRAAGPLPSGLGEVPVVAVLRFRFDVGGVTMRQIVPTYFRWRLVAPRG